MPISNLIFKIFTYSAVIQRRILRASLNYTANNRHTRIKRKWIITAIVIFLIIAANIINKFTEASGFTFKIASIIIIIYCIVNFVLNLGKSLVNLRLFMTTASISSLIISALFGLLMQNSSLQFLVFAISFCLLWIFWSLIGNTKVSTIE